MRVLASGATGKYAGMVIPELLHRGIEVRAAAHDPDKAEDLRTAGVDDVVDLDMTDDASVRAAVDGVDGVFLITPAFHPDATAMCLTTIAAAVDAGVRKIVYNGVYHPSLSLVNHAGTRAVEEALYAADVDFTVLQPAMYVQALAETYEAALDSGAVVAPWSRHSKMSYVDYRDVAEVAAMAYVDERLSYGTFELAAGGMVDRVEIARLMSQAAGRTLRAEDPDPGAPNPAAPDPDAPAGLTDMFADYDRVGFHGGNALVLRAILEREPRSVAGFIAELGRS